MTTFRTCTVPLPLTASRAAVRARRDSDPGRSPAALWITALLLVVSNQLRAQESADPARIVQEQEQQSGELARRWLASDDPWVRAWGAYLARRDRHTSLLPLLTELATRHVVLSRGTSEEHIAMLGVLDAVIQLEGLLPPLEAARLYPEFPMQSILLLSRAGPAGLGPLQRLFRDEHSRNGAWLAMANLLRARRSPGLARDLLASLTINVTVQVVSDATDRGAPGGVAGSCIGGFLQTGFRGPPVGTYVVSAAGVLIADGPDPSFYHRSEGVPTAAGSGGDIPCSHMYADRNRLRTRLLASLAGEPADRPSLHETEAFILVWRGDRQYRRELRDWIVRHQRRVEVLLDRLTQTGWLVAADRAVSRPQVILHFRDERRQARSPLPPSGDLPSHVWIAN